MSIFYSSFSKIWQSSRIKLRKIHMTKGKKVWRQIHVISGKAIILLDKTRISDQFLGPSSACEIGRIRPLNRAVTEGAKKARREKDLQKAASKGKHVKIIVSRDSILLLLLQATLEDFNFLWELNSLEIPWVYKEHLFQMLQHLGTINTL